MVLFSDKHIITRIRYPYSLFNMGEHARYIARHVETDLCFGKRLDVDNSDQVKFTKGKQEDKPKKMQALNERHKVQVQDIRGQESSYTLDKNGFVYLSHEMPELARVSDEEYVKEMIIPETESLVRKMSVPKSQNKYVCLMIREAN